MAYPTYHCSATSRCSFCHTTFLNISLALSGLLIFMLCVPSPFFAQFLFCGIQLLHSDPSSHLNYLYKQQSHQPPTTTTTTTPSLLCTVYLYLLCTLCMQCSPFLCMLQPRQSSPPLKCSA
jgi:hypothetical protein